LSAEVALEADHFDSYLQKDNPGGRSLCAHDDLGQETYRPGGQCFFRTASSSFFRCASISCRWFATSER
jgi:hypothetical protein